MRFVNTFTRYISAALFVILLTAATSVKAQNTIVYITGPGFVPCGGSGFYSAHPHGSGMVTSYSWLATFSSGGAASGGGPSFFLNFPNASGVASISLTATVRENGNYRTVFAHYHTSYGGAAPSQPGTISGIASTCNANSTATYAISPVSGASTYNWSVSSPYRIINPVTGTLVTSYSGPQTSVSVRFPSSGSVSNGYVRVSATSGGACSATSAVRSKTVKFGAQAATMSGPTTVTRFGIASYGLNGGGFSNISWSTPSGFDPLTGTNGTNLVVEVLGTSGGPVTASYQACGVTRSITKYVSVRNNGGGGPFLEYPRRDALEEDVIQIEGLYPNPATEFVTLSASSELKSVVVMNLVGQVVKDAEEVSGNKATVSVVDLKSGNYFIVAVSADGRKVHPLVVE